MNYVTLDAKTNLSEGLTMISFYVMIVRRFVTPWLASPGLFELTGVPFWQATAAWWYPGQPQVADFLSCPSSVASAIANGVSEGSGSNLARF